MKREKTAYLAYVVFCLGLMTLIFGTAYLAFEKDMNSVYQAFSYTCHQKFSRSLCLFKNDIGNMWISNCLPQEGMFVSSAQDRIKIDTIVDGIRGFKLPVCARDIGLYGGLLLGALFYPLMFELNSKKVLPTKYLILAIVPMGIDGSVQLISELGALPFVYESTNTLRIITGLIAGIVATFYAIPILMNMIDSNENKK